MSRISYFPRYSQKENLATNNTLLVMRRFYDASPFKIERALSSLIDEELDIGLSFEQQVRGEKSIPDAIISQRALRIFFETKRGGELNHDQIARHIDTIAVKHTKEQTDILIGLTKEEIAQTDVDKMKALAKKKGVVFSAVTFSQLLDALRGGCENNEIDLVAIVEDFEEYLSVENLLEERNQWLPIFPCGVSYDENKQFKLYYEPASRPSKRNYRFIGIYAQKRVSLIGEVEAIVIANDDNGELHMETEWGTCTIDHEIRIKSVVDAIPHRYYLVHRFLETDIKKTSPGGIRGLRYLDIRELIPEFDQKRRYRSDEIADFLKGTKFT